MVPAQVAGVLARAVPSKRRRVAFFCRGIVEPTQPVTEEREAVFP